MLGARHFDPIELCDVATAHTQTAAISNIIQAAMSDLAAEKGRSIVIHGKPAQEASGPDFPWWEASHPLFVIYVFDACASRVARFCRSFPDSYLQGFRQSRRLKQLCGRGALTAQERRAFRRSFTILEGNRA